MCKGSEIPLPGTLLSSQLQTCISSHLLNIATKDLRGCSDSTGSSQTHTLHAPDLVPFQRVRPLITIRASQKPGNHPTTSFSLTPDATNFTSTMQNLPNSFHLTCCHPSPSHLAFCLAQTVARASYLVSHTHLVTLQSIPHFSKYKSNHHPFLLLHTCQWFLIALMKCSSPP